MLCVGEILNFMKFVALCWMLDCDWEIPVGKGRRQSLAEAADGFKQNPPRCSGAAMLRGEVLGEIRRRWRTGAAQLSGV